MPMSIPSYPSRAPSGIPGFDEALRQGDSAQARFIANANAADAAKVAAAKREFWKKTALMAGSFAALPAGAALAGLYSGGAGAAAGGGGAIAGGSPWAVTPLASGAAMHAPAAAGVATGGLMSGLWSGANSPAAGMAVNAGMSYLSQRSQTKANDRARQDATKAQAEALAVERQRLELEAKNADLDREDARALNAAINELKKRELDLAESVRLFDQDQYLKSEQRREPYRQRGAQALDRLAGMWSLG